MLLQDVVIEVRRTVSEFSLWPEDDLIGETELIGPNAVLKSRQLVEVLLSLEKFEETELGVEFDWMSDSAMSASGSVFRSIANLAQHLYQLQTKT